MIVMRVNASIQNIKGVGEKTAEQFAQAGLHTVHDIVTFFPRAYEDYSHITSIRDIVPGKVTLKAVCESVTTRPVRRGMRVTTAVLTDGAAKIQAVWFNQPYREKQLKGEGEFLFSGIFELRHGRYQLTNPSAEKATDVQQQSDQIVPIYRGTAGLKTPMVRKVLHELRTYIAALPETLPAEMVQSESLMSYSEAVMAMHFPETIEETERARERLGFEELLQLLLASQLNKRENAKLQGWGIPFSQPVVKAFVGALPFTLTAAQRRAAWDILQDVERDVPMNRLLQGDVGSGKTVVAGLVARQVAAHGFQSAVMAPTEILATQHAATLDKLLAPFDVKVGLLTGSVKGKARETLLKAIADGTVDVVVGTHALIQSTVSFHKLGFVVIDEQHRFGVAQRQELMKKSAKMPHLLTMTATPIPRSLALTVYGDLDISILNERPADRLPIETKLWSPNSRDQLYQKVEDELKKGRQAYVVCSLIDNNLDNEAKSVQDEYRKLQHSVFKHRKIGLLHGKLPAAEKESIMSQFSAGQIDILVSTTVIEVGVDVPNATVMLIEDADRFGLAQLHQLRGRVGRSSHQSYCYLVMSDSKAPSSRLKEIERSNDGFYLAEVDLKLRGPGEIYGRMQHGALNLQIATLGDTKLIARAQKQAKWFVESGQSLVNYEVLSAQVEQYQRLTTLN